MVEYERVNLGYVSAVRKATKTYKCPLAQGHSGLVVSTRASGVGGSIPKTVLRVRNLHALTVHVSKQFSNYNIPMLNSEKITIKTTHKSVSDIRRCSVNMEDTKHLTLV